jgi:glutathione S-transferase
MKLYGSLTSPYVRKCRILIKEKNLPCEFVAAGPSDPGSPVPQLNPLGKVPVLELDIGETANAPSMARGPRLDPIGETLFDSPVIVEYLDSLKSPALLAPAGDARWQVLRWQALADGILDAVVARMLEMRRPVGQQSLDNIERQEKKIRDALSYADRTRQGQAYLMSDHFTLADLTLAVALEYIDFRYAHDWRSRHPHLALWLAGIGARPAFAATVPPGMEPTRGAPH